MIDFRFFKLFPWSILLTGFNHYWTFGKWCQAGRIIRGGWFRRYWVWFWPDQPEPSSDQARSRQSSGDSQNGSEGMAPEPSRQSAR